MSRQLYRDPVNGKISGVCAGLANYFSIEAWLVRILVISAAVLGGAFLVLLAYVAMTLMLDKEPMDYAQKVKSSQDHSLKNKPWQAGRSPSELINTLERDLDQMERQLRNIEAHVTSEAFQFEKEFNKL